MQNNYQFILNSLFNKYLITLRLRYGRKLFLAPSVKKLYFFLDHVLRYYFYSNILFLYTKKQTKLLKVYKYLFVFFPDLKKRYLTKKRLKLSSIFYVFLNCLRFIGLYVNGGLEVFLHIGDTDDA